MKKPNHSTPGAELRRQIVNGKDLTVKQTAALLGLSWVQLSYVMNGQCEITPDMCQRLAIVFNEDPVKWATLQMQYDLEQAKKKIDGLGLKPFTP